MEKQLIKYFKSLGIEVYTNTKARGHQGFFLRNRIDVSKNTKPERIIPTLLHEFSHFIHNKIEPDMAKTGGSLEIIFNIQNVEVKKVKSDPKQLSFLGFFNPFSKNTKQISDSIEEQEPAPECFYDPKLKSKLEKELLLVTNFVDEHSLCHKLIDHREQIKTKIKKLEEIIKEDYPNFMRSKKFKEFDKYIKKSKAKYLLKFDKVKFITPKVFNLIKKEEIFSIESIERDFPEMSRAFCAYIRLKSNIRKQSRISSRINRLNKYYSKPTELFARLIEGLYIDKARTQACAPYATQSFFELLEQGYYFELKNVFEMLEITPVLTQTRQICHQNTDWQLAEYQ